MKEVTIKIKNVNNFDKEQLFETVKKVVKVQKSDTLRGRQQLKMLNKFIEAGMNRGCYGRQAEVDSIFSLVNNNGWLAGFSYGGHYCPDPIDLMI